jgi:hypothetical protein
MLGGKWINGKPRVWSDGTGGGNGSTAGWGDGLKHQEITCICAMVGRPLCRTFFDCRGNSVLSNTPIVLYAFRSSPVVALALSEETNDSRITARLGLLE